MEVICLQLLMYLSCKYRAHFLVTDRYYFQLNILTNEATIAEAIQLQVGLANNTMYVTCIVHRHFVICIILSHRKRSHSQRRHCWLGSQLSIGQLNRRVH